MKEHAFKPFMDTLDNLEAITRLESIFTYIDQHFPQLDKRVAWNQPMYTDHGTFIIAFSVSKKHISVAPEFKGMRQFEAAIKKVGYPQSKMLFRLPNNQPIHYDLLKDIIAFNIEDKKHITSFWRTHED